MVNNKMHKMPQSNNNNTQLHSHQLVYSKKHSRGTIAQISGYPDFFTGDAPWRRQPTGSISRRCKESLWHIYLLAFY